MRALLARGDVAAAVVLARKLYAEAATLDDKHSALPFAYNALGSLFTREAQHELEQMLLRHMGLLEQARDRDRRAQLAETMLVKGGGLS